MKSKGNNYLATKPSMLGVTHEIKESYFTSIFCVYFLYTAFDVDYVMFAMNVLKYFICVIVSSLSVVGIINMIQLASWSQNT